MKTKFLKLHNFIQREFYSDSKQYFSKRFYFAFESIPFNKNQIIHWDNKNELKFLSLVMQHPFIEDLISYRKKINTLEEYCDISYDIITDYFKRLKKENTLYTNDFFESKQEVFANNVVKDKRGDFFISLKTIFTMIEEKHSIDLEENNREQTSEINKKVKSEYNLVALKYMLLNEYKKVPFEYITYEERNKKIVQKESQTYKEVINSGSVKSGFKNVGNFEIFLNKDKNSDYIDVLKQDTDIANEEDIILFLDKLKKNQKMN
jgi:hypothetical protein